MFYKLIFFCFLGANILHAAEKQVPCLEVQQEANKIVPIYRTAVDQLDKPDAVVLQNALNFRKSIKKLHKTKTEQEFTEIMQAMSTLIKHDFSQMKKDAQAIEKRKLEIQEQLDEETKIIGFLSYLSKLSQVERNKTIEDFVFDIEKQASSDEKQLLGKKMLTILKAIQAQKNIFFIKKERLDILNKAKALLSALDFLYNF